ncbi:MAG: hypothetical protein IPO63_08380 [Bacteroidetes bacterium]|nr:hypothetical protein [Bacteroidota bacterium]
MIKTKTRFFSIKNLFAFVLADIFVFILFGLLLMGYDDNYDKSKGEYWSLASMNSTEILIYFSYNVWIILNIIGLVIIVRKVYIGKIKGK